MEYKELLKEYFDNLDIKDVKSSDMRKARADFKNTLKVMYGRSKFPKKTYCEEFDSTRIELEDFSDTVLLTGLTTSLPDTQIINGQLQFNANGTVTYENNLSDLSQIVLTFAGSGATGATIIISIENQLGEVLFTDTQTYSVDGDYIFTPGLTKKCNMKVIITIEDIVFPSGITNLSLNLDSIMFTFAKHNLTLPSDMIVPSKVVFTSSEGYEIASSEILLEEYVAWIPFRLTNSESLTSQVTDPIKRYVTRENFLYDRTIGYLFRTDPSGISLWWKPAIRGKVTIVYSSLANIDIEEGKMDKALEAFSDALVAGATFRGLRRKLVTVDPTNKASFDSLVVSVRDFKAEFRNRQKDWIEFTKARATAVKIEPFDFLNDPDMLRI